MKKHIKFYRCIPFFLILSVLTGIIGFSVRAYAAKHPFYQEIPECQLFVYSPSYEELLSNAEKLLKRFYGNNYLAMKSRFEMDSKAMYGINAFDLNSVRDAGIQTDRPMAYVEITPGNGFLYLPVKSRSRVENYLKTYIGANAVYSFRGNYVLITAKPEVLSQINGSVAGFDSFQLAEKKLNLKGDKIFAWIDNVYLRGFAGQYGVNQNAAAGITGIELEQSRDKIRFRIYSGIESDAQSMLMNELNRVSADEKFEFMDFSKENYASAVYLFMNLRIIYRYYMAVDQSNLLKAKGLIEDLENRTGISIEERLISASDGRVRLLVDQMSTDIKKNGVTGSIGIKDTAKVKSFISDMNRKLAAEKGVSVFSFDLFTNPFYHYQSDSYQLYYGMVENEFIFSTDREKLTRTVENIFEDNSGGLKSYPQFFYQAVSEDRKGVYVTMDGQRLLGSLGYTFPFIQPFIIGIRQIDLSSVPDQGQDPYGWNTTVDVHFFK